MRNVAAQVFAFRLPELFTLETHAELRGLDEAMVPTTQIKIDPRDGAVWHRRGPEDSVTACGARYNACAIREYIAHRSDLCRDCFTLYERTVPAA